MISVPSVKRWGDIHCTVYERCVECDCERKKPKRNIAQGKSKCEWVKRAGGQPCKDDRCEEQAVIVDEWKESTDHRKSRCCEKKNSPRSHQTTQIHSEGPDEHQRHVECGTDPGSFIKANSNVPFEIGQTESNHAASQRDSSRSYDDAKNPEQRTLREMGRRNFRDRLGDLRRQGQA